MPTGVGYSGRPMEAGNAPFLPQLGRWCGAGSAEGGWPSIVTVNVWSEMFATPMTAGPTSKVLAGRLPAVSITVLCAGQNWSGTHCATLLSTHSNLPLIAGSDL